MVNKYVVMNERKKTIGKRKIEEDKAIYFDYKSEESQARMFMKKILFQLLYLCQFKFKVSSFYSSIYFKYLLPSLLFCFIFIRNK